MSFRRHVFTISIWCFTLALGSYIAIREFALPQYITDPIALAIVIAFLSALGIYSLIFRIFYWIYGRYLYRYLDGRLNIGGAWYQVLTIQGKTTESEAIRHGLCHIDAEFDKITLSGQNHKADRANSFSSNWRSKATALVDRELVVHYTSTGINRRKDFETTVGVMEYNIIGSPPAYLKGSWRDAAPSGNIGTVIIFREEAEYERHLAQVKSSYS